MAMTKRVKADTAMIPAEPLEAPEALAAVKKFKATKFDQSVEICMHLGVDVKHADQMVRGSVSLPKGIGKSKKVIAFCAPEHVKDALAAGAIEAGGEDLVSKVKGGWFDFDVAIASPDMMRVMSVLGKVLGPKGLMPSPKNGTVTPKVAEAVKDFSAGKLEYRADKGGNVHAILGKMSFSEADLLENYSHFVATIEKARPSTVKGRYVKKITLSGTMTPGVQVAVVGDEE